jgi:hypothetical protein
MNESGCYLCENAQHVRKARPGSQVMSRNAALNSLSVGKGAVKVELSPVHGSFAGVTFAHVSS